MAYRFVRTSNESVEFAITPFSGYTFGAFTWAMFYRPAEHFGRSFFAITNDTYSTRVCVQNSGTTVDDLRFISNNSANFSATPVVIPSVTTWYLIVFTWSGSGAPRYHVYDGTSWVHGNTDAAAVATAITGTDRLRIGGHSPVSTFSADVVCAGIKMANSTDLQVESLTATAFQSWRNFNFDWLIGFDSSLESAGILQDQGTVGTGDEIAISGTTQVSDPPGWSWTDSSVWFGSTDGSAGLVGWPIAYIAGQSFVAPASGNITAARGMMRVTSGSDQAIVAVYSNVAGSPEALLGSSDAATVPTGSPAMVNFAFSTPVAVVSGTSYFLMIMPISGSGNLEIEQSTVGTTYYRGGLGGSPPNPFGTADIVAGFRSYLEAAIVGTVLTPNTDSGTASLKFTPSSTEIGTHSYVDAVTASLAFTPTVSEVFRPAISLDAATVGLKFSVSSLETFAFLNIDADTTRLTFTPSSVLIAEYIDANTAFLKYTPITTHECVSQLRPQFTSFSRNKWSGATMSGFIIADPSRHYVGVVSEQPKQDPC
jgi:hypothetical protein